MEVTAIVARKLPRGEDATGEEIPLSPFLPSLPLLSIPNTLSMISSMEYFIAARDRFVP